MLLNIRNPIAFRQLLRSPVFICTAILFVIIHIEYHYAAVSNFLGRDRPLLARLSNQARPVPFIALSDAPYGPFGLRDDFYFFPIPSADGKTLAIMSWLDIHGQTVWPLQYDAEIWCRGDRDTKWSQAILKRDQLDPQGYILVLECEASGEYATLQLRQPKAGSKSVIVPLQSIRPHRYRAGSAGPHIVAMTMMGSWDRRLPAWLEYQLLHGVDEVYIYENVCWYPEGDVADLQSHDSTDDTLRRALEPYVQAGLVIIVPFFHVLLNTYAPGWVQQQLLAVNHIVRSMDGYADWVLLCDVDEFPSFTPVADPSSSPQQVTLFNYADHLDQAMAADPNVGEISMLNCYTSTAHWISPDEPITTVVDGVATTIKPAAMADYRPVATLPTVQVAGMNQLSIIPDTVHRFASCSAHTYRSKVFVRPAYVTVQSVHHVPAGNGTDNIQDPDSGLWLMHISDHNGETVGAQIELDMSRVSRQVEEALERRYRGFAPDLADRGEG